MDTTASRSHTPNKLQQLGRYVYALCIAWVMNQLQHLIFTLSGWFINGVYWQNLSREIIQSFWYLVVIYMLPVEASANRLFISENYLDGLIFHLWSSLQGVQSTKWQPHLLSISWLILFLLLRVCSGPLVSYLIPFHKASVGEISQFARLVCRARL